MDPIESDRLPYISCLVDPNIRRVIPERMLAADLIRSKWIRTTMGIGRAIRRAAANTAATTTAAAAVDAVD